jgi:rod shape-determining protein MreD
VSAFDAGRDADRLRSSPARAVRSATVDAEISVAPRFSALLAIAFGVAVLQSTVLSGVELRGAHLSLLTVLVVWTGLRCGVVTGGWLGLFAGALADALGGGGVNVLGFTLAGFGAGMLANRFFWDSLPVFVGAVAGATIVRSFIAYALLAIAFGERGAFTRTAHETAWSIILNCALAAGALAVMRSARNLRTGRA